MKEIHLIGSFRVGTNYTRTLIELNYRARVRYDALGWKHGLIPTFTRASPYTYAEIRPLAVVKNPFATLTSWFKHTEDGKKNIRIRYEDFKDYLRAPVIYRNDQMDRAPEYYFPSPVDMWASVTWNHAHFADEFDGLAVKYEDLLRAPEDTTQLIAAKYELEPHEGQAFQVPTAAMKRMGDNHRRDHREPSSYMSNESFQRREWFLNSEYMAMFDADDLQFVADRLPHELVRRFNYSAERLV